MNTIKERAGTKMGKLNIKKRKLSVGLTDIGHLVIFEFLMSNKYFFSKSIPQIMYGTHTKHTKNIIYLKFKFLFSRFSNPKWNR